MRLAYNEDDAKLLCLRPSYSVSVDFIYRVRSGRVRVSKSRSVAFFFNEYVRYEVVNDRSVDRRVCPGPQDDARRRDNFKCVEHVADANWNKTSSYQSP